MKIRNMTMNDYEEMCQLWDNTSGLGISDWDDSRDSIERYLVRNPSSCFIAEQNGKIVGTVLGGHDGRRGFIYHMAVIASERKKGVGKEMLDQVMEALRLEGIGKVALVAFSDNELGNKFWESQGFDLREDLIYRNKIICQ